MKCLLIIVALTLAGCTKKGQDYYVPIKYCELQYTGRTSEVQDVTYTCAGYDQNMVCNNNIPSYSSHIVREVVTRCAWVSWQ